MKKLFILLLLVLVSNVGFSQLPLKRNLTVRSDDGAVQQTILLSHGSYAPLPFSAPPQGTVPFLKSYGDYATNGNSLGQLIVSGDTIIVGISTVDSTEAPSAATGTSARMTYNFSIDGGLTWADANGFDLSSDRKTRFPNMSIATIGGLRTVVATGRVYDPGTSSVRHPGFTRDLLLGGGSGLVTTILGGATSTDYFGELRPDGKLGGSFQSADTLWYTTGDPSAGTYTTPVFIFRTATANTVSSSSTASSQSGNSMTCDWCFVNTDATTDPRTNRYATSTDGGASWTVNTVLESNVINGDSVSPYWHEDVEYKPGTNTPYVVFCTRDIFASNLTADQSRKAYKIIMAGPGLANPVVVADWHNTPILSSGDIFARVVKLQINANPVGHPTIGFSADGGTIFVAFSAAQVDTNGADVGSVAGFNYNDIFITKSQDNGATWSTPLNVTQTPAVDEMYPVLERWNNTPNLAGLTYQSDPIPGSGTFTDLQTVSRTSQVFKKVLVVGIKDINSNVPSSFALKQNFPNPFNPTTNIRFDMLKSGNVTLKVYDISGKEVVTLLNNQFATVGTKEVTFDAKSIASGIYFYTLSTSDFKETKKMMLVK